MGHRWVGRAIDVALLVTAVIAVLSGVVAAQLDLHGFTVHRWSGYLMAVLVAVHVWSHARRGRGRSGVRQRAGAAARPVAGPSPGHPDPSPVATGDAAPHPSRRAALVAGGAGLAGVATGWLGHDRVSPDPYPGGDVGLFYHHESSLGLLDLVAGVVHWGRRPAPYERVGRADPVPLPEVGPLPGMSVAQALTQRRSRREYADRAMTARELAWVLWAATGITSDAGFRTAPSAGALFPIETYVAVERVAGLDPGVYHLDVRDQALEPVHSGSVSSELMIAGLGQDFLGQAPAVVILTGLFQRTRWKYHARHYRYVCWEGGHLAQNVYLSAEAAGLGACMVGGFLDSRINRLLHVDGQREAALGLVAVGPG